MKAKISARMAGKTIRGYVDGLPAEQGKIVSSLIALVSESAPKAILSIKWGQPVFDQNGPFCYVRAHKSHITFGFWRGLDISAGRGILQSSGQKMAHIRITKEGDFQKELFQHWVKEAVHLNETKGDPTKNK